MTVTETMKRIRALGMTVRYRDREWRINHPKGSENTAYYTGDPDDALDTAKAMVGNRDPQFVTKPLIQMAVDIIVRIMRETDTEETLVDEVIDAVLQMLGELNFRLTPMDAGRVRKAYDRAADMDPA
jgi:hypothetical protein